MKKIILLLLLIVSVDLSAEISLDKNDWWVHKGFNKKWLVEDHSHDETWKRVNGKVVKIDDIYKEKDNLTWEYTITTSFDSPKDILNMNNALGFRIPGVGEAWQLYINGKLLRDEFNVAKDGTILVNRAVRGAIVDFSPSLLKEKDNILVFHIAGNPKFWRTGLYQYPGFVIDNFIKLQKNHSELIVFMLMTFYIVIGLFYFVMYFTRNKESYVLFLGMFTIGLFVYFFSRTDYVFEIFRSSNIILRVEYCTLFLMFPAFYGFLDSLYFHKLSKYVKALYVMSILLAIAAIVTPFYYTRVVLYVWQIMALLSLSYFFYMNYLAIRNKIEEVKFLLPGAFIVILTSVYDVLDSMFFGTGLAFTKYGFFLFVVGLVTILFIKFVRVYNRVEELNVNLEVLVEDRTLELVQSLKKVENLKFQQDGDYFLTSLIMEPLSRNDSQNNNVIIDEIVKQKKSFSFKNKAVEIGGDINVSSDIVLGNNEYLLFVNSDAMGKSMQGAGGAIVIGVSFNLFINRTKRYGHYHDSTPTEWIKEAVKDLQRIFSGFNGSMLASLVVGLLEIDTGMLYYLNAEHPKPILYRSGQAMFFPGEQNMYKIGVDYENSNFDVSKMKLRSGDQVILGSDGKDDINIGTKDNIEFDEDENLMLKIVEKSLGNLDLMVEMIKGNGDIIDDFSLLSVKYVPKK